MLKIKNTFQMRKNFVQFVGLKQKQTLLVSLISYKKILTFRGKIKQVAE